MAALTGNGARGSIGPGTRMAIRIWRKARGYPVSIYFNRLQYQALFPEVPPKRAQRAKTRKTRNALASVRKRRRKAARRNARGRRNVRRRGRRRPSVNGLRGQFKTHCLILLSFFLSRIKQTGADRGQCPFQAGLRR